MVKQTNDSRRIVTIRQGVCGTCSSYIAGMVMCFIVVGMLSPFLESVYGRYFIQLIQCLIMFACIYPSLKDKAREIGLDEESNMPSYHSRKVFKASVITLLLLSYIGPILLVLMKLNIMSDVLYVYKLLSIQYWGALMNMMTQLQVQLLMKSK